MNARAISFTCLGLFLFTAMRARAQCAGWQAGPLDNGALPNGTDSEVAAMTLWDPSGTGLNPYLVVAGAFTTIQGVSVNYIALRDPATGNWQSIGGGMDGAVAALTQYNGELIAAGLFTHAGGVAVENIARWNGVSWRTLSSPISVPAGTNGLIRALTVYNGELIVGGEFTQAGLASAQNIAMWDSTSVAGWRPLGTGVSGCSVPGCHVDVSCLVPWSGSLIAGGSFITAGGVSVDHIAAWNGTSWQALTGGGANDAVSCLQPYNGVLVAGGVFTVAGLQTANHVAYWDGSTWNPLGSGVDANVHGLTVYNGNLIAGGLFSNAGGAPASRIAAWNGASWQALAGGVTPSYVDAMIPYGTELIVGGVFNTAGGHPANNIARWSGFAWGPFGGGNVYAVHAMTNYAGQLVTAGEFHQTTSVGLAAHNIVRWNGAALSGVGPGTNGAVYALKSFSFGTIIHRTDELIAGGLFSVAGGAAVNNIARWDQSALIGTNPTWQPMGSGFNNYVFAIERYNNQTYAGGAFTSSSSPVSYIARFNDGTQQWEALGTGMNGTVYALKVFNGFLYAGGLFTTAGGVATGGLARFDGTNWTAVGSLVLDGVYGLEVYGGLLAIGGSFAGISGSPNLIYFDGTNFGTFGTGGTNSPVGVLNAAGSRLYAGSGFTTIGGVTASNVAYWDGASWHDMAGGVNGGVGALCSYNGEEDAAGVFTSAGNGIVPANEWARFSSTGIPWFATQPSSQTVNLGDNVSFKATPCSGYSGVTYRWYHNGTPLSDGPSGFGSTLSGTQTTALTISGVAAGDEASYFLVQSVACGNDTSSTVALSINGVTGVADMPPGATVFEAISPNPAFGTATLAFSLARGAKVRAQVHDIAGRLVDSIDLGPMRAGHHQASWSARRADGRRVSGGVYFVSLEIDGKLLSSKRVAIVR